MIEKLFLAILLVTILMTAAPAQSNPERAILAAREEISNIKTRSIDLERVKRDAEKRPVSENFRSSFPEIKEDFEKLQKLDGEIFRLISVENSVNYSAVLRSASEINHRAARLKKNLFTVEEDKNPETKNDRQNQPPDNLKILLKRLDKSVASFVNSPIFKNTDLLNTQDSLRAKNDLEKIIEVSSVIKQQTKKLAKKDSNN